MARLVLRFSGESTIERHRDMIAKRSHVWWAWWRKEDGQEADQVGLLSQVSAAAAAGGIDVHLVNRKEDRYFRARCTGLQFDDQGRPMPSPDSSATPEYYRTRAFPAWFCFEEIHEIDVATYLRACGEIPLGNATLFEVVREGEAVSLRPKPTWDVRAMGAPGEGILHISDLHFGDDHERYPAGPSRPGLDVHGEPLAAVLERVAHQADVGVGVVVVAGDIVTRADYGAFREFEAFADDLAGRLGLQRHHFVIVPGNHDFDVVTDPVAMKQTYAHESDFRRFVRSFYAQPITDLERVQRFRTPKGRDLMFFALNSARLRGEKTKSYGYVGAHRYVPMVEWALQQAWQGQADEDRLAIAVMHHHVLPLQPIEYVAGASAISVTADANELRENLQRLGVRLLLHGHQHLPFVGQISALPVNRGQWGSRLAQPPLYVVGNGSSASHRRLNHLPQNCTGVHWLDEAGVHVTFASYLPGTAAERFIDVVLPTDPPWVGAPDAMTPTG